MVKGHILISSVLYDYVSHSYVRRAHSRQPIIINHRLEHVHDTVEKLTTALRWAFNIVGATAINLWNTFNLQELTAQTYHAVAGEEAGTQKVYRAKERGKKPMSQSSTILNYSFLTL